MNIAATVLGVLCVALAAGCVVQTVRLGTAQAAHSTATAERDRYALQVAEQRTAHEVAMREKDNRQRKALRAIARIYEQEQSNAQAAHDKVVADLRDGLVRLRERWTCPAAAATADLSTAAGAAGSADASAELRAASAGRVVRAGAECDAQVRGLQAVVLAYQEQQGVPQ